MSTTIKHIKCDYCGHDNIINTEFIKVENNKPYVCTMCLSDDNVVYYLMKNEKSFVRKMKIEKIKERINGCN